MRSVPKLDNKRLTWVLTLVYFSSYATRINLSAIISEMVTATGFSKTELAVSLVTLSVTYGLGQIINGVLGDRIKPVNMIFTGLLTATVINLVFPFFATAPMIMSLLWGLNGFVQAMIWPPIVKILVANMDDAMYAYASVRISWGSSLGTIFIYLSAPLVISLFGWQGVFVVSAAIGALSTAIWFKVKDRIHLSGITVSPEQDTKQVFCFPKHIRYPLLFIALGIVFQGMLRDGVTSWMPSYLSEVFQLGNRTSIFCTVSLAIFSIISFSLADVLYRRFFTNEVVCSAVIFSFAVGIALLLYWFDSGVLLTILLMALLTACMHGVNLMLVSHVPKRFKKYGNISTVSGVLNACTYVGSAIFTYGVALLSETIGWHYTIGVWAMIALAGTLCCAIAAKPWRSICSRAKER